MSRYVAGFLCVIVPFAAFAYPDLHSICESTRIEALRKGWPPDLKVTLDDWGLQGPVECLNAREEKPDGIREEHCFNRAGRIVRSTYDDSDYFDKQMEYEYDADRLVRTTLRYKNGEVSTQTLEYDARGYLVRLVGVATTDVEKRKRFFAEHSMTESPGSEARANEEKRVELAFEYGAQGYSSQIRCVSPRSNDSCLSTEQQLIVDSSGHLRRSVAPAVMDPLARIDFSKPADGHMSTARMEAEITYEEGNRLAFRRIFRNSAPFSALVQIANDRDDIVLEVHPALPGKPETSYRYQYDKYENWIMRQVGDGPRITREIFYAAAGK